MNPAATQQRDPSAGAQPPLPNSPPPVQDDGTKEGDLVDMGMIGREEFALPDSVKLGGDLAIYYAPDIKFGARVVCVVGGKGEVERDLLLTTTEVNLCWKGEMKVDVKVADIHKIVLREGVSKIVVVSARQPDILLDLPRTDPDFLTVLKKVYAANTTRLLPVEDHSRNPTPTPPVSEVVSENIIRNYQDSRRFTKSTFDASNSLGERGSDPASPLPPYQYHHNNENAPLKRPSSLGTADGYTPAVPLDVKLTCNECHSPLTVAQNYCSRCGARVHGGGQSGRAPLLAKMAMLKGQMQGVGIKKSGGGIPEGDLAAMPVGDKDKLITQQHGAIKSLQMYLEQQAVLSAEQTARLDELQSALLDETSSVSNTTLMLGSDSDSGSSSDEMLYVKNPFKSKKKYPSATNEQQRELTAMRKELQDATSGTYVEYLQGKTAGLEVEIAKLRKWGKKAREKERARNKNLRAWADSQVRRGAVVEKEEKSKPVASNLALFESKNILSSTIQVVEQKKSIAKEGESKPKPLRPETSLLLPNTQSRTAHTTTIQKGLFVPLTSSVLNTPNPLARVPPPYIRGKPMTSPTPPPPPMMQSSSGFPPHSPSPSEFSVVVQPQQPGKTPPSTPAWQQLTLESEEAPGIVANPREGAHQSDKRGGTREVEVPKNKPSPNPVAAAIAAAAVSPSDVLSKPSKTEIPRSNKYLMKVDPACRHYSPVRRGPEAKHVAPPDVPNPPSSEMLRKAYECKSCQHK